MQTEITAANTNTAGASLNGWNWPNLPLRNYTSLAACKSAQRVYEVNSQGRTYRYYDDNGFTFINGSQCPPVGMIEDCD